MIRYKELLLLFGAMFALSSCSSTDSQSEEGSGSDPIEFRGANATMGTMAAEGAPLQNRKVDDFAVNTTLDPTASMNDRKDWSLEIQIYKGGTPYPEGEALFAWNYGTSTWEPDRDIYFPNYTKQFVSAKMTPPTWQNEIEVDQSREELLLAQDILTQNGETTVTVNPAHIPTIEMRHGHSMLNFIVDNADESHIDDIIVVQGSDRYLPYRVQNPSKIEYMVILPPNTSYPEIRLTTKDGANYRERIEIGSTQPNVCYCIHLNGVELILSTISVANWTFGKALAGDYSASTSYPTFEGIPSATYTLHYDNGLQQDVTFNSNGERTLKPLGRTLIKIEKDGISVEVNIILRSMVIDLMPYFE